MTMLCSSSTHRRHTRSHHPFIPNFLFFWCRPIGADDALRRFMVIAKSRSKSSTAPTTAVWAKPLSYSELLDTINGEATKSNTVTLEIFGVNALKKDCWDEICFRFSLWKKPIRQVSFLSLHSDDHVAKLVSSVSIVSLCLYLNGSVGGTSELDCSVVAGYTKILEAASKNKALRELSIRQHGNFPSPSLPKQPLARLSQTDFKIIMKSLLPRLQRLELPSSILRNGDQSPHIRFWEQKLIEYAENHLHCVIVITKTDDDKDNKDECKEDIFHDYLEWHNQIHWYRLSLLKAMVTAQKISRYNLSYQADMIGTVDAGIRVLKDWFRSTTYTAQRRPATVVTDHHHEGISTTARVTHTINRKEQDNQ
jgi:hypothetical protein